MKNVTFDLCVRNMNHHFIRLSCEADFEMSFHEEINFSNMILKEI